jgi:hypothetical protein
MNIKNEESFLGMLDTLLKRGQVIYAKYISDGKKFLYAKILKDNNEKIRELILAHTYLLPVEQQSNAIDLLIHIDVWIVLWNDLYNKDKFFYLYEEFSFENTVNFPKDSVNSLCYYYENIKMKEVEL